jgi:hypothetical protein
VDRVPLSRLTGSGLGGGQPPGGDGSQRFAHVRRLPVAAEPVPEVGPVAVEDVAFPVGFFQAAQEPEQVPLPGRQRVRDRLGPRGEHGPVVRRAGRGLAGGEEPVRQPALVLPGLVARRDQFREPAGVRGLAVGELQQLRVALGHGEHAKSQPP